MLGLRAHASLAEAETEYRRHAKVAHPDNGGSAERMAELNAAIAEARAEFRADTSVAALGAAYARGETDEFVKPTLNEKD